jgi:hypothetical protein
MSRKSTAGVIIIAIILAITTTIGGTTVTIPTAPITASAQFFQVLKVHQERTAHKDHKDLRENRAL